MPRIRFCYDNLYALSATTLAASSSASALPIGASQNHDRNYVWRSATAAVAVDIEIDLGSVKAVNALAVANLLLFAGGALELYHRGDAGAPGAAVLVDTFTSADYHATRKAGARFFAQQSHRHWRLTFTNPGGANAFVELGYAFLGTYFEPGANWRVPSERGLRTDAAVLKAPSGGRSVTQRPIYEALSLQFSLVPDADVATFETLFRTVGLGTPVFAVRDPGVAASCYLAFCAGPPVITEENAIGRATVSQSLEEAA